MGVDQVLVLLSEALHTGAIVAGPILLVSLVIGILVSILQVATQVQEMTLTFVPKLIGVAMLILFFGEWMLSGLTEFTKSMFLLIPELG